MAHHYEGTDLIVRKIRVGDMENNTYVLECPETHEAVLIDGCFEPETFLDGARDASIVGILQTHGHRDHVQALKALKEKLQVPVYAHPGDDYPIAVDHSLSHGEVVSFGQRGVSVLYTPGHTPGGACFLSGRHLVSGDTLFPGGPGNTWNDRKAFEQIIESISTHLLTLPDDTVLCPGHGPLTTVGEQKQHNPFFTA